MIYPVAVLFSVVFSLGMLQKNNELSAVYNAGLPLSTVLMPSVIFVSAICCLLFFFNETLIYKTYYRHKILHRKFRFIKEDPAAIRKEITVFGKNNKIYFVQEYNPHNKSISNATILFLNPDNTFNRTVNCSSLVYLPGEGQWRGSNVYIRNWEQKTITGTVFYRQQIIDLPEMPYHFENEEKHVEDMSIQESLRYARKIEDIGGNYNARYTDFYQKTSMPFIALIILFFGIPFSVFSRKSVLVLAFALAIITSFLFYILIYTGVSLGHNMVLPPFIAGWLGNLVFIVIGFYIRKKITV